MGITVSGIETALDGNDWFLIDKSGDFFLDKTVMATIWLVGGGMDGTDGFTDNRGFLHGGIGGQGGNVYKFGKIKLKQGEKYAVIVANVNEPSGTSFKFGQILFNSGQMGHTCVFGGAGGIINPNGAVISPAFGKDGVETPYGFVGSSGGGGVCTAVVNNITKSTEMSRGGIGAGNSRRYLISGLNWDDFKDKNPNVDAVNYGCGGGGNTYCVGLNDIGVKSHGIRGCVIVQYEVIKDGEDAPDCSIHYWSKPKPTNESEDANEFK